MENTYVFLGIILIVVLSVALYSGYVFLKMPTTSQIKQIKEWLLYAVALAEKELGAGTGKLKLRYVYDMFISKFPHLSRMISFDSFSLLVDEALDVFREMLEQNKNVNDYVNAR